MLQEHGVDTSHQYRMPRRTTTTTTTTTDGARPVFRVVTGTQYDGRPTDKIRVQEVVQNRWDGHPGELDGEGEEEAGIPRGITSAVGAGHEHAGRTRLDGTVGKATTTTTTTAGGRRRGPDPRPRRGTRSHRTIRLGGFADREHEGTVGSVSRAPVPRNGTGDAMRVRCTPVEPPGSALRIAGRRPVLQRRPITRRPVLAVFDGRRSGNPARVGISPTHAQDQCQGRQGVRTESVRHGRCHDRQRVPMVRRRCAHDEITRLSRALLLDAAHHRKERKNYRGHAHTNQRQMIYKGDDIAVSNSVLVYDVPSIFHFTLQIYRAGGTLKEMERTVDRVFTSLEWLISSTSSCSHFPGSHGWLMHDDGHVRIPGGLHRYRHRRRLADIWVAPFHERMIATTRQETEQSISRDHGLVVAS